MHVNDDPTEMEEATNQTNPGMDRRQTHLHTLQPLSQCSDLIPKVTLPSTQAVHIPPETQRGKKNVTIKYLILCAFNLMLIDIIFFIYDPDVPYCVYWSLSPNCSWIMEKLKACRCCYSNHGKVKPGHLIREEAVFCLQS